MLRPQEKWYTLNRLYRFDTLMKSIMSCTVSTTISPMIPLSWDRKIKFDSYYMTHSFGYKIHSSFKHAVHVSHEFAHSVHSWSQPSPLGPGPSQFSKHGKQGSQLRHSVSHWSQAVWYPSISSSWVFVILPTAVTTMHDKNLIKRFILKRILSFLNFEPKVSEKSKLDVAYIQAVWASGWWIRAALSH